MKPWIAALMIVLAGPAVAQHHQHGQPPYAGLEHRTVKALSDQQISDLRAGRGMGLALPAELNGYPGPLHVIELADRLQLTSAQRAQVQRLYEAMKAEAISVGEKLITHEAALDRLFAERIVSPRSLAQLTAQIGETQGQLRAVHLKYHLTTAELLTADQRQRYAQLRGYR
jgi:Spy/CpxP family protein refolding chaperone